MVRDIRFIALASTIGVVVVLIGLSFPAVAIAVLGATALIVLAAARPYWISPVLLVLAGIFARPNILGSVGAEISLMLAGLAALVAIISDARSTHSRSYIWSPVLWLSVSFVGMAGALIARGEIASFDLVLRSAALTLGVVIAAVIVLADARRRVVAAKAFLVLLAAIAGSYVVSVVAWFAIGPEATLITPFVLNEGGYTFQLHAPFTVTLAEFTLPNGTVLPRLAGLGREPGWMAMYAAFAFFLAPKIGWKSFALRGLMAVALIGTFSTAGFAVFAAFLAYDLFLRRHVRLDGTVTFVLRVVGTLAMLAAIWVAAFAPAIGLEAKSTTDRYSYGQRIDATDAGIRALLESPFVGGGAATVVGGVNLIAAIAMYGIVFSLGVSLAIWWPRIKHPNKRATTAAVGVIFVTLLTSQPSADSTWVFVCVLLAYASTFKDLSGSLKNDSEFPRAYPQSSRRRYFSR